jgi:pilus assembly protein CpaF
MQRALAVVEEEVRELIRRRAIDPARDDGEQLRALVDEVLLDYGARVLKSNLPVIEDESSLRKTVIDRVAGFGPLQPFMDDPGVEEIWINGPGRVFCASRGRHVLTTVVLSDQEIRDLVERMLRASGRRLDLSSPFVDAMLADGSQIGRASCRERV